MIYLIFVQNDSLSSGSNSILMLRSKELMNSVLNTIKLEKEQLGIKIDSDVDINQTGLIGVEYSPITTTLGHLEAKRTTVNPDAAAMICGIFLEAGLKPGDTVAIGSSASFPGLLIATLSACRVLELNPITMVSVGSSQYGANLQAFTVIEMMKVLESNFGEVFRPDIVSYGGNNDIANDLEEEVREFISQKIKDSGYGLLYEENFSENIKKRMALYDELSDGQIKLFVNIGGANANMGKSFEVLNLEPGLNKEITKIPSEEDRGVIFEFASREVDVLHLLYVKGLCLKYGLLWDPVPLTEDSYKNLIFFHEQNNEKFVVFYIVYFLVIFVSIIIFKRTQGQP
jgi:poly-gamma-glutamate system protein